MVDDFDRAWTLFVHPWECWGGAASGVCRVVNDPADPGGDTIHGVARRFNPDVWKNGPPDVVLAGEVMRERYWKPAQCDALPWPLNLVVFDWAVNAGEDDPGVVLQVLAGFADVQVDEDIGPATAEAVLRWMARAAAARVLEHRRAGIHLKHNARYESGWLRRVRALGELAQTS